MTDEQEQSPTEEPSPPEQSAEPEATYVKLRWGGVLDVWQCLRCAYDTQSEVEMIHHAEVGCPQHWQEMREEAERRSR